MVLLACAPGVAEVADVVVDVDVEVDVDVDVDGDVLLLEPQATSARLSATVMVAAVKCFIDQFLPKIGPVPAPATRNETSRSRPQKLLVELRSSRHRRNTSRRGGYAVRNTYAVTTGPHRVLRGGGRLHDVHRRRSADGLRR